MPGTEIDIDQEFARLDEVLSAFEALAERGADALEMRADDVSGWSVGQHLYHSALATDLALGHVRSLVRGKGMLIREEGELDAYAAEILANDATPRGEAEAPRMVRPGDEVDPKLLALEQRTNRERVAEIREMCDSIEGAAGWVPHQTLGTLRAVHWLRFAALHARHHWAIVRDVETAVNR